MQNVTTRGFGKRSLRVSVAAVFLLVAGCATPDGNTYTSADVGQVIETSQGRVLSSRQVDIKSDENSGAGTLAGGAVGGATGAQFGSGNGQLLAAVIGAVIGASAGYLAESEIRSREGIEYIVELEDGRVVTLVQNQTDEEAAIANGDPVLVQFGSQYTRISRLEIDSSGAFGKGKSGGGSGGWINPDQVPPSAGPTDSPGALKETEVLPWQQPDSGQQQGQPE